MMLSEKNLALKETMREQESITNTSKLVKLSQEIVELRKELKDVRAECCESLFLIRV